ncbi:Arginine N-methyltransferase 2 [Coniochaeta hoffmannii]|uniref:Arginine N-methyltransferase 2 n=1 Tax=Coniochaeta hoffmannii TaxID=91930 RepID=A0AA38S7T3_9PEZI|nr:Arginine N-methyltransferase 2 [Coniochaeta hoffmannii]
MDDSISARIPPSCPPETQQILTAAWSHDVATVKKLLDTPGRASARDPVTGETPLHAAIRALGPVPGPEASEEEKKEDEASVEAAIATIKELFLWGAIWNDVDDRDETPGCLADRLGRGEVYNLCVEAGVRAELLFGLFQNDEYEELDSGDEEMEDGEEGDHVEIEMEDGHVNGAPEDGEEAPELVQTKEQEPQRANGGPDVNSEEYLKSHLTLDETKLVDEDGNGVMMAWETEIMRQSKDTLLPEPQQGKRILNVGFGMGIIDSMFADTKPAQHHIIEAHPEVLKRISAPDSKFGAEWEASSPEPGAYKVHQGKWQEICPQLLAEGLVYDAIYFDTFGEDYSQLKEFFTDYVPGLLDTDGVFGFFNGLGADRKICYDVYTKVVEMHLADAGLDVDWKVIDVDLKGLEEAGKGEWEGVRRRYWTLDKYRLPVCTFLG